MQTDMSSKSNFLHVYSNSLLLNNATEESVADENDDIESDNKQSCASFELTNNNYQHFTQNYPLYNNTLSDELIEYNSNSISATAKPGCYTLTRCDLSKQGLSNIDILRYHKYITHLNLSRNYLTDLDALGYLPFLKYLDVSQNLLTKLLDFETPLTIKYMDYSYNLIERIPNLSHCWSLEHLNISHNLIANISGLENLSLEFLDLSYNYIRFIDGLVSLNMNHLCLDHNEIETTNYTSTKSSHTISRCKILSIAFNTLESLKPFEDMHNLEKLNVHDNQISKLSDLLYLCNKTNLYCLDMRNNPIQENVKYKNTAIYYVNKLQYLDGRKIHFYEKGTVNFNFCNSKEVTARHYNSMQNVLYNMATPSIEDETNIFEKKQLIIVLVGSTSARTQHLAVNIKNNYPKNKVKLGLVTTTRPQCSHEIDGADYYFVSRIKFKQDLEKGNFITCVKEYGQYFGISKDELHDTNNTHAIIFAVDLNSGLQLKNRFQDSKLIFAMPKSKETHRSWLIQDFHTNAWISTYIQAYNIVFQGIGLDALNDQFKDQKMCSAILEEIVDYVEKMHERKSRETEEMSQNTKSISNDYCADEYGSMMSPNLIASDSKIASISSNFFLPSVLFSSQKLVENCNYINDDRASSPKVESQNQSKVNQKISDDSLRKFKRYQPTSGLNAPSDDGSFNTLCGSYTTDGISLRREMSSNINSVSDEEFTDSNSSVEFTLNSTDDSLQSNETLVADNKSTLPKSDLKVQPNCLNLFIEDQLKLRDIYMETFANSPGLQYYQVFTDEIEEATKHVCNVIKQCLQSSSKKNEEWKKKLNNLKYDEMVFAREKYIFRVSS